MGIIAALKKRYKYLYLKDVLDFYELDDEARNRKKNQGRRLCRGVAKFLYGNPAHILDAASYVKDAWILLPKRLLKMLSSRHIVNMLLTVHIWLLFFIIWGGYHNFSILVFEYLILVLKRKMDILIEKSWPFHSCLYNCIGHWKLSTLTTNRAQSMFNQLLLHTWHWHPKF